jgi:EAL and modified HD-GYP domain-containing signal transduction protein
MAANIQSPERAGIARLEPQQGVRAAGAAAEPCEGVRYVTRQPILDLRSKVYAYELLFSSGPGTTVRGDGEIAARTMIDNTVLFGLEKLACGLPAFVRCTAETLTGTLVEVLPAAMTVLEIPETMDPSPDLVGTCRNLKAAGYRFALDKFTWKPGIEPLVQEAAYVKVDFSHTHPQERRELLGRLGGARATRVAEKVETQEQFVQAREEGFALAQGFYFCRPVLLESRKVPANRLSQLEILRLLRDESLNLHKLTQLVKRDTSLTYRLLRLVNSPVCAMQQEVRSIQAALLAVGEDTFRRMATVAIASEMNASQPTELLRMALVRGRFCELAATRCRWDCSEQYLLGLLSLLWAMLRTPMKELAPALPLREEIRRAMLGEPIEERSLLEWLEHYELGDWEACDAVASARKLDTEDLLCSYQEAVAWAEATLYFA